MQELNFRSAVNVWGYFSVHASGGIHEFAVRSRVPLPPPTCSSPLLESPPIFPPPFHPQDSQFGHCFAWGKTRESARNSMVLALKELSIRADFRTTAEYLVKCVGPFALFPLFPPPASPAPQATGAARVPSSAGYHRVAGPPHSRAHEGRRAGA